MRKKAQAWGFDLVIGSILFIVGIIAFYIYALNAPEQGQEILNTLSYNGNLVANSLLSEGFPDNWNQNDVTRIGILNDNRINETKLEKFYTLHLNNYQRTKSLFNIKYEYFVNLSGSGQFVLLSDSTPISGIGNQPPADPENLIKTTRFTIYRNKPVTLNIYVWE